jgi:hypothetical protein
MYGGWVVLMAWLCLRGPYRRGTIYRTNIVYSTHE